MKKVTVSAPGKIHLMGEHAVVYGKPALLSAINKRLIVTIEGSKAVNSRPGLEAGEIQIRTIPQEADSYIRHAINVTCRSLRKELPSIQILVKTDIPPGFHLGSSAAIAVATVGAMYYYFTKKWDLEKINALSYEVEKKMHGNPSGGDNTTVTYGGFIRYQKISETKKIFEKLPLSLSKNLQHFYLIDTGRPKENTGIMVVLVREQYNKNPNKFNAIFDTNEKQVERILEALKTGDEKTLIDGTIVYEEVLRPEKFSFSLIKKNKGIYSFTQNQKEYWYYQSNGKKILLSNNLEYIYHYMEEKDMEKRKNCLSSESEKYIIIQSEFIKKYFSAFDNWEFSDRSLYFDFSKSDRWNGCII